MTSEGNDPRVVGLKEVKELIVGSRVSLVKRVNQVKRVRVQSGVPGDGVPSEGTGRSKPGKGVNEGESWCRERKRCEIT